jgi:phenylalanyl-tRNA synthetase beta subunit
MTPHADTGRERRAIAPLPRYPALTLDCTSTDHWEVPAAEWMGRIQRAGGPWFEAVEVLALYERGAQRTLTWRLTFRHPDRTLTHAEVAPYRTAVEAVLTPEEQ